MVNLTRIYTRTGDAGSTHLADMSRAKKTDARIEAYGAIDEANTILGMVVTQPDLPVGVFEVLRTVQNELFDAGADLSTPLAENPAWEPLRILGPSIDRLEQWCDEFSEGLPTLRSFVLPGGTFTSALLHQARAVVRRSEREGWRAVEQFGTEPGATPGSGGVNLAALTYLNRLSDLLFILARVATQQAGEVLWIPGKDRDQLDDRARQQRERIIRSQATSRPDDPPPEEQPPTS